VLFFTCPQSDNGLNYANFLLLGFAIFGFDGTAVDQGVSLDVATDCVACQRGGRVQLSIDVTVRVGKLRFAASVGATSARFGRSFGGRHEWRRLVRVGAFKPPDWFH